MSDTLYEYYDTGEDGETSFGGAVWRGQTFTIGTVGTNEAHNITSVKLKLYKRGTGSDVTAHIRATASGLPTGADLATSTVRDGTAFLTTPGQLEELVFPTPFTAQPSVKYAVILSAVTTASIGHRWDATSPSYTGGSLVNSSDSGGTWGADASKDLIFYEYGTLAGTAYDRQVDEALTLTDSPSRAASFSRTVGETTTLTDSPSRTAAFARSAAETITLADTPARAAAFARTTSETITLTDAPARTAAFARTTTETITLTDSAARAAVFARTIAEAITLLDAPTRTALFLRLVAETLTLTDAVDYIKYPGGGGINYERTVSETLTLTDSPARAAAFSRTVAEILGLVDTAVRAGVFNRTVAEALWLTEIATGVKDYAGIPSIMVLSSYDQKRSFDAATKRESSNPMKKDSLTAEAKKETSSTRKKDSSDAGVNI